MKPISLAAQLAAVETELTCLKLALAEAKKDRDGLLQERDGLRQERDAWRAVAEKLNDDALSKADERHVAPPERRRWGRRLANG
jgi:hypothetical protein